MLTLAIMAGASPIPGEWQIGLLISVVMVVGIPHGAVDHVLFMEDSKRDIRYFYFFYIGLMLLYGLLWYMAPLISMGLFLIMSAYHFGESQFSAYEPQFNASGKLMNVSWGTSILSGLIWYNREELQSFPVGSDNVQGIITLLTNDLFFYLLISGTFLSILILSWWAYNGMINREKIATELYVLALIHICFYITPLLIGFSLYFAVLHSAKVLDEEFRFLKKRKDLDHWSQFVKLLLPFTTVSLLGTALLLAISVSGFLPVSNILLILILVSSLTLPHSIVMHGFYAKMFNRRSPSK